MSASKNLIISIGRQYGSGGLEIAQELAKLLGVNYYDKQIIEESARNSGLSKEYFESKDERSPLAISSILTSGIFAMGDMSHNFCDEQVFKIVSDGLRSIAEKSSSVIVGRCSNYILRDCPRLISIFIYSPIKDRVKRVADREIVSEREALNLIKRHDKARASYFNFYTDMKWGDTLSYDITINSSLLSVEECAEVLKNAIVTIDSNRLTK